MGDYTLQQTFSLSYDDMLTMLYDGRIDYDTFEAHSLYHDLIMFARFDRPMTFYNDMPLQMVYAYVLMRLIMMRIAPFVSAYPKAPKTRFSSDLNRSYHGLAHSFKFSLLYAF